jgi:putative salt-induced outer membrane protein YdiY
MKRVIAASVLTIAVAVCQGRAGDGLKAKVGLGVDSASGNSEVTALTADLEAGYTSGANLYSLAASYGYAETDEELSRQNSLLSVKYDRALTELAYVYAIAENVYDKVALVDSRLTVGPGVGVFLLKSDGISLKTDIGLSYIDQTLRDDGLENNLEDVTALRVTQRLEMKLSENASMWQSAEYLPDTDDFDAYLLNAELGVESKVTGSTSFRFVVANRRNSVPPAGVEKDDLTVKAALTFALSGE